MKSMQPSLLQRDRCEIMYMLTYFELKTENRVQIRRIEITSNYHTDKQLVKKLPVNDFVKCLVLLIDVEDVCFSLYELHCGGLNYNHIFRTCLSKV